MASMNIQDRLDRVSSVWLYDDPTIMIANLMVQAADRLNELETCINSLIENGYVEPMAALWIRENVLAESNEDLPEGGGYES